MSCTPDNCIDTNPQLWPYGRCGHGFWKCLPVERAEIELQGWKLTSSFLNVPQLLERRAFKDFDVLFYEDIFDSGRSEMLLGDLIAHADRDARYLPRVHELVDDICGELLNAVEIRGAVSTLDQCVPALYAGRLQRGGRIDDWYVNALDSITVSRDPLLTLADVQGWDLVIGESRYVIDISGVVARLRDVLAPSSRWLAATTQGDPTEPNIATPLCWLDFEHAGLNAIVSEAANLLWYLAGMGGWLVPAYQPDVYRRSLRSHLPPIVVPAVDEVVVSTEHRRIELDYSWAYGAGRAIAIETVFSKLIHPLAGRPGGIEGFGAFFSLRILGIIHWAKMSPPDILLCLARLLECQFPDWSPSALRPTRGK